jgi:hypothetical protein
MNPLLWKLVDSIDMMGFLAKPMKYEKWSPTEDKIIES